MKILRVIRADAIEDGDQTFDGKPVSIFDIVDHEEHAGVREYQRSLKHINADGEVIEGVVAAEIAGDSPQEITIRIGKEKLTMSPSDLIVVMR